MRGVAGGSSTWICVLVVVHLVWGIARIPGRVWGRRLEEIAHYREVGANRFFLDPEAENRMDGVDATSWLLAHSPGDSVVLWRGEAKGAFELASGVLAPRWLVYADRVPPAAREFLGRPIAAGERGAAVLVGGGTSLVLEFR